MPRLCGPPAKKRRPFSDKDSKPIPDTLEGSGLVPLRGQNRRAFLLLLCKPIFSFPELLSILIFRMTKVKPLLDKGKGILYNQNKNLQEKIWARKFTWLGSE
jgi:hypothetical protein